MAIFDSVTKKFTCQCGCGEEVNFPFADWKNGHWNRTLEGRQKIADANYGKVYTDEERKAFSEGHLRSYREDPTLADRVAEACSGWFFTDEERENLSRIKLQQYKDDSTLAERIGRANFLKVHDEEWNQHVSEGIKEAYRRDPTYAERSRGSNFLRVHSEETRRKQSEFWKEYWNSEEGTREKERRSKEMTGYYFGEEHRRNTSEGVRQSYENNPELREVRAEQKRRYWENLGYFGLSGAYGCGWSAVREAIILRDNFVCQGCSIKGDFSTLVVHHIDGCSYNLDEYNLITVCYSCNTKAVHNESYWINFYSKRIEEIYNKLGRRILVSG